MTHSLCNIHISIYTCRYELLPGIHFGKRSADRQGAGNRKRLPDKGLRLRQPTCPQPPLSTMASAIVLLSLALSALASPLATSSSTPHHDPPFVLAPVITPQAEPHNLLNDSYIVMLKPGVLQGEMHAHLDFMRTANDEHPLIGDDAGLQRVYDGIGIQGYAGTFSEATVEKLRTRYEVDYIEKDQIVHTMDVQKGAPWVSRVVTRAIQRSCEPILSRVLHVSLTARSLVSVPSLVMNMTLVVERVSLREFSPGL